MRKSYDRTAMLQFIRDFVEKKGYAPTVGEIQQALEISSKSVVHRYLDALEDEGFIKREGQVTRGIEVSGIGGRTRVVPLLGTIAAGQPIPVPTEDTWHAVALENVEIPADLLRSPNGTYALLVKGTSMIDALVDDGDIVIMEAVVSVEDGQMVAAWLTDRNEATLKRFYREKGRIRLQPANQTMKPIYVDPDKVQIQGKVVAVLRRYKQ